MPSNLFPVAHRSILLKSAILYVGVLFILAAIGLQPFVQIKMLTSDALVAARGQFYYGMLSNFGILLWSAAASICLFSFLVLKSLGIKKNRLFLLCAGLLSLSLLLDDQFLLHDQVLPKYLRLNEKLLIAFYPVATLFFLLHFRDVLLKTPYLVLLSSLMFLGLSVVVDALTSNTDNIQFLIEDGLKFLGITGWFYFFTSVSINILKTSLVNRVNTAAQYHQTPLQTILPEITQEQLALVEDEV